MELQPHLVITGLDEMTVDNLVFLPGAQRLIPGYRDGTMRIWDVENRKQEGTSVRHSGGSIGCLL